jgi:RecB family exonuclease
MKMLSLRQTILNDAELCGFLCKERWKPYGEPYDGEDGNGELDDYTNKYASVGTAIHKTMEHWGRNKNTGISLTLLEMHDILDENFKEIPFDLFKDECDRQEFYNSAHEQINYLYEHNGEMIPVFLEIPFTLPDLIEGLPPFHGTIDRIDGNFRTHDVHIVDYKSGKVYYKHELKGNMQATIYCLAFKKIYGFYPEDFTFQFSKHKKSKTIYVTEQFIEEGTERIKKAWDKILKERFFPDCANKHFCKGFCPIVEKCPKMKTKKGWEKVGFEIFRPEENV